MSIRDLIEETLLSVEIAPSAPPVLEDCQEVEKVAQTSPAARLELHPGDLLVSIDGQKAGAIDDIDTLSGDEHTWVFFRAGREEKVTARTTGAPIGVETGVTAAGLAANWHFEQVGKLVDLWARGTSDGLVGKLARRELPAPATGLMGAIKSMFGGGGISEDPFVPLEAASRYEAGDRDAIQTIAAWYELHAQKWTANFHALCEYYLGRDAEENGRKDWALEAYLRAFEHLPCNRIADRIVGMGADKPTSADARQGRAFPVDYTLPSESGTEVGLQATMDAMTSGQVLLVNLMANYRSNGPYSDVMKKYATWSRWFSPRWIVGMHVISTKDGIDRPGWRSGEEQAKKAGASFEVLHDTEALPIAESVGQRGAPEIHVVDRLGTVLATKLDDGAAVWDVLSRAS